MKPEGLHRGMVRRKALRRVDRTMRSELAPEVGCTKPRRWTGRHDDLMGGQGVAREVDALPGPGCNCHDCSAGIWNGET